MNGSVDVTATGSPECWKIIHIPEKDPVLPHLQPTVDVIASAIEPKHANTLVRKLNHIAPLEGLRHVKRIRKTCLDGARLFDRKKSIIFNLMHGFWRRWRVQLYARCCVGACEYVPVCKYAASTKEEWEEQCKLWPTSFHPPTYNIDGITGFSEEDSLSVFNFMKLAVRMAKSGVLVVNAAVIVDPSTRQVITSSRDQVLPCDALTNATSSESGCSKQPEATTHYDADKMEKNPILLTKCSSNEANQSYKNVSCLHSWGWLEQQSHLSYDSWHPLRHAAIVAIENSAARDRLLFPLNEQDAEFAQEDYMVPSPTSSPLKRQKVNTIVNDDVRMDCHTNCHSTRPYLCTGYDIYFVWEPCIICTMNSGVLWQLCIRE